MPPRRDGGRRGRNAFGMKRASVLLAALAALAAATPAAAGPYKSMWITDVLSGRTVGPVVNKPGNRFSAGGSQWIVLQSGPGEVNFAAADTLAPQGPYGLVEQRMFELGSDAYVFTRILDYEGGDPGADEAVESQAERAPAEKGRHPWSADLPERWVLAPLPSTNPGAHKEPGRSWHPDRLDVAPSATVWIEPFRKDDFEWSLGGLSGSDAAVETRRIGVSGFWNGFFGEAAFSASGKTDGTLVPDGTSLSELELGGGDGWHLAAGYRYAVVIDGPWSAEASAFGTYDTLSADVSAVTAAEGAAPPAESGPDDGDGGAPAGPAASFRDWKTGVTMDGFRIGVGLGLSYDEWYWGAAARLVVDCWTDTKIDAKVPVLGTDYELEAERAHPVGGQIGVWYCPAGNWLLEASVSLGTETALRLGAGMFF